MQNSDGYVFELHLAEQTEVLQLDKTKRLIISELRWYHETHTSSLKLMGEVCFILEDI